MTCTQTEKVSLLIDGELPPSEASEVKQHLQHCAECLDAHESFLLLRSQLTSYHSAIDASAVNAALSKVLSRPVNTQPTFVAPGWRERLAAAFSPGRAFNTGFVAAAALVILAFAIGVIALLLRQEEQPQFAINTTEQNAPVVPAASPQQGADERKPQAQKGGNEAPPATPNNKGGMKPKPAQTPDRTVPKKPRRRAETTPNYAAIEDNVAQVQSLDPVELESMTARHLEQSELLLRAFRNVRTAKVGQAPDINHERQRAQKLLYQNILVRREADAKGDVQVATLLGSLEPILLDIANLRAKPRNEDVVAIKERVERKSLVPLLQINSAAVARAYE